MLTDIALAVPRIDESSVMLNVPYEESVAPPLRFMP